MARFSNLYRADLIEKLTDNRFDVLIIGGGITGAGIALDASSRGMKTALVDMQDFAAGTSSRSTKLIHGGLRYLQQKELAMVAEVGQERAIVYENGPHVTKPEWMLLPFYEGGNLTPITANVGLRLYDFLAKVKKQERRIMLSPKEVLEKEPLLKSDKLKGGGYYAEYKTDDARLTIEVLKKAVEFGAQPLNYAKVEELIYEKGTVAGVQIEDQLTGDQYQLFANKIVNATGPWGDTIRELDGSKKGKTLHLTKGVHLVFDGNRFPLQQAVYFDNLDGRMMFAIPRGKKTYVGTTDTTYDDYIATPTVTTADREYIIDAINNMFPALQINESDVESSWAGLRPLIGEDGKDPGEISRKDEIFISDSGLITIAGGKLTGYRKMAEDVVDIIVKQLKKEKDILYSSSETKKIPISGGFVGGSTAFKQFKKEQINHARELGIEEETANQLIDRYGSNVVGVFGRCDKLTNEAAKAGLDVIIFAQLRYAIEEECIYKPDDFFVRRTGALFFDIDWVITYKQAVVDYLAQVFYWSPEQKSFYMRELDQLLDSATHPVS